MADSPVVLVTAGSAGLGAAASRLFAKNGYRVVVNYHSDSARADQLIAELNDTGNSNNDEKPHIIIKADLASHEDVNRLVSETHDAMGRIDVIFSNGGWSRFRDVTRLDDNVFDEDWDRAYAMNVKSHLWLLHAAEKHLSETEGAFITTASIAGVKGTGSSLAYGVTKAAQLHMIKALASMVGPKIRVNTVSPGLLETEWAKRFTDEQKTNHKQGTKLKRFVEVDDVAEQVLGLAKNNSMTGVNIIMDAGFTV
ncbi:hypothetical protein K4F52_001142 [Lecanicillium sp. MT-2017a]|nr:hypothetical protein K4F52_001142 [Lecanicillium sp. MT-2017a]